MAVEHRRIGSASGHGLLRRLAVGDLLADRKRTIEDRLGGRYEFTTRLWALGENPLRFSFSTNVVRFSWSSCAALLVMPLA